MNTKERAMYSEIILRSEERAAIGCVAVESARLEDLVEHGVWLLLGLDRDQGQAVTGKMLWAHKYGLLERLIEAAGGSIADDFMALNARATNAMAARRQIIHGYWGMPEGKEIINYLRALLMHDERTEEMEAQATYKKTQPLLASEVIKIAREFSKLHYDLAGFLVKHFPTNS